MWVALGHTYGAVFYVPIANLEGWMEMLKHASTIWSSYFAVDTFFYLSGFLGMYLMVDKLWVKKGRFNFFMNYFFLVLHRYIRLFPAMLFMIGVTMWLLPYLGDGVIFWKS
jgi:peptidoglycan/LPS O-acetylase OafA/YrhL